MNIFTSFLVCNSCMSVITYVSVVLDRDAFLRLGERDTDKDTVIKVSHDREIAILYILYKDIGAGSGHC